MKHRATPDFWAGYRSLPLEVQQLADQAFARLKKNPRHPSLRFKKVGDYWSVRVGGSHRALAIQGSGELIWFWIGTHANYDKHLH